MPSSPGSNIGGLNSQTAGNPVAAFNDINKAATQLAKTLSKIADMGSKGHRLQSLESTGQQVASGGASSGGLGLGSVSTKLLGASAALLGAAKFLTASTGVTSNMGGLNDLATTDVFEILAATISNAITKVFGPEAFQNALQAFVKGVDDFATQVKAIVDWFDRNLPKDAKSYEDPVSFGRGSYDKFMGGPGATIWNGFTPTNPSGVDKGPK